MKNFLSVVNCTILLFISHQLVCSELNDFSEANNCEHTTKQISKPSKRLSYKPAETLQAPTEVIGAPELTKNLQSQSTIKIPVHCQGQFQPQSESKASSILTSPQVQLAADVTAAVVTTVAKVGYQAGSWAFNKVIETYNNRNKSSENTVESYNNDSNYDANSDSDSGSDSGSDFCKIKAEKKAPKRKSFFRDQSELQESLHKSTGSTLHKLNQVVKNYFEQQEPDELVTQKDMRHTFTLLDQTNQHTKRLDLPSVIADDYNIHQRNLLIKIIDNHVNNIEPEFEMTHEATIKKATNDYNRRIANAKKKHDRDIKKADEAYLQSLNKSKNTIHTFAYNSEYLNRRATQKADHQAHDLSNFQTSESYKNFIANTRKSQTESRITEYQDCVLSEPVASISLNNSELTTHAAISTGKNKKKNKAQQDN